ncbi:hypothetical protein [Bradyrhizobium acaciae]|uniref:hypothetical protein n=1 Tax=Bradyrhizobium acaciae TaxID=2683706 RepID=UPI001E5A83BD|nr:hypothetical protein [Bradyrhizobium acaciae]MCC8984875.1 hypothetical protein [Bradyrhizobium acaciae]
MRPTTAPVDNVLAFRLPPEGRQYEHPRDLLRDPGLTRAAKRSILASWASDACAVASNPALRAPRELRSPVPVSDILDALRALDDPREPPGGRPARLHSTERHVAAA